MNGGEELIGWGRDGSENEGGGGERTGERKEG